MLSRSSREHFLPPLWVLTIVACGVCLWLLVQLKEIVVLLVVGYAIAYLINPWLTWLERHKVGRAVGVVVIMVGLVALIALLALTAMPTIAREYLKFADNLPGYIETAKERLHPIVAHLRSLVPAGFIDGDLSSVELQDLPGVNPDVVKQLVGGALKVLGRGYSLTMAIVNIVLLPFIVFYLAVDFPQMHRSALQLFPVLRRDRIKSVFLEMDSYISAFVRGQVLVGAILALLYAIGLKIVGIELWFLVGLVAGFSNVVPYLGFLIGIVLGTLMALVTFHDFIHVVWVWVVFAVVQALEGSVITPRVLGDNVGLSPLVVILAVFAGGALFGVLGIFLAVPVAASLRVLMMHLGEWVRERG